MPTYNIDDRYCPKGHLWIFVPSSLVFQDCYYCQGCDKIYRVTYKEVTREWFQKNYNSDRFQAIKNRALISEALKKVTNEDLVKLGYLK